MLIPAIFEKFKVFFGKRIFFFKKSQLLRVLRNQTVPFAFDIQLVNFNCFQKIQVFFSKNHLFFRIQKLNVSRNLTNSVNAAASLLPLAFYRKFNVFLWELIFFLNKKKQILNVLRIFSISFALYSKFATFSRFWKVQDFSENLFMFLIKLKFFELFEKTSNFSCVLQQNSYL